MQCTPSWTANRQQRPLVIAHRGIRSAAAENTLAAFARAREVGADGVELDVRLAADLEAVVYHDADLERLAGRRERVKALSSRQLAEVALVDGGRIPRLAEVLACTRDLLVNIEIKSPRAEGDSLRSPAAAALVDAVIDAVDAERRANGAGERDAQRAPGAGAGARRVLISSFDPLALARLRRRRPTWPVALLAHGGQAWPFRRGALLPWLRPLAFHPHEELVSKRALARWSRRGYRVHAWTVNDPIRARALAAAGVHALITDEPTRLLASLG